MKVKKIIIKKKCKKCNKVLEPKIYGVCRDCKKSMISNWKFENEELMKLRLKWYKNRDVYWLVLSQLKNRESIFQLKIPDCIDVPIRWMKSFSSDHFNRNIKRYSFAKEPMNIFYSIATYEFLPTMSMDLNKKKVQMVEWNELVNKDSNKFIKGYDLFIDLDCDIHDNIKDNINESYKEFIKLKEIFKPFDLPLVESFSGKKGFHIELKYQFMPKEITSLPINDQVMLQKKIMGILKSAFKLKYIDLKIYDLKRYSKVKYSLDVTSGLICLPLNDKEIYNFNLDIVKPENLIKNPNRIKNYGLMIESRLQKAEIFHDTVSNFYSAILKLADKIKEEN
jgi:hypothetical protein